MPPLHTARPFQMDYEMSEEHVYLNSVGSEKGPYINLYSCEPTAENQRQRLVIFWEEDSGNNIEE
jgi:hypothetical protein